MAFDQQFVKPSVLDLVQALEAAQRAANDDVELLKLAHEELGAAVAATRGIAEGYREWLGGEYLTTAAVAMWWWTDSIGRRRFRVRGERRPPAGVNPPPDVVTQGRPTWWFFSGPRCFHRRTDARQGWVVVCDCGETGLPADIGWTGDRCAACHDRAEEGTPVPVAVGLGNVDWEERRGTEQPPNEPLEVFFALLQEGRLDGAEETVGEVAAWSSDYRSVAVIGESIVTVFRVIEGQWSRRWSAELPPPSDPERPYEWVTLFSPDGSRLALVRDEPLIVLDEHGVSQPVQQIERHGGFHLAFAEGGRVLFRLDRYGGTVCGWRWDGERWTLFHDLSFPVMWHHAISPDGRLLARLDNQPGVAIHDLIEDRELGRIARMLHVQPTDFAFAPDGSLLLRTEDECVLVPWRLLLGIG